MEIRIKKIPGQPTIFSKISYVLGGILLASSILSIGIKLLGTYGTGVGFLLCITISYLGLTKTKNRSGLRLVAWGILGTVIFSLIALAIFYYALSKAMK